MVRPDLGVYRITQRFGDNPDYYGAAGHTGVDLGTPIGSPLYAGISGVVSHVVDHPTGGLFVQIKGDKYSVYTGHMKAASVRVGDKVTEGQVIGQSGNSGNVTGPHVHWQVRDISGKLVDPLTLKLNEGDDMADSQIFTMLNETNKRVDKLESTQASLFEILNQSQINVAGALEAIKKLDKGQSGQESALARLYEIVNEAQMNLEDVKKLAEKAVQGSDTAGIAGVLKEMLEVLKKQGDRGEV